MPPFPPVQLIFVEIIDFRLSSSVTLSLRRSLSDRLERGLSLELPSRRTTFAVAYHQPGHSLAMGRLWFDRGYLEALYARHWAQYWTIQATASIPRPLPLGALGITTSPALGGGPAQMRLQAEHASTRQSLVYSYASLGRTVGFQFCRRITEDPAFWLGTEVYYAASEVSGGCTIIPNYHKSSNLISL